MRPITDILREVRQGRAVVLATTLLDEVVRAVNETGKSGSVTLTIEIKPAKDGSSEKSISVKVKSKRPETDVPEAVFFSDDSGDLHRSDPKQTEMPLQDIRKRQSADA